jgi:hypothetical protein
LKDAAEPRIEKSMLDDFLLGGIQDCVHERWGISRGKTIPQEINSKLAVLNRRTQ